MQAVAITRLLPLLAWLLLAAGCGQLPERTSRPAADPAATRAAGLTASGEHLAAAELYRQLAARTPAPGQRADYLLAAAEASRAGNDWDGVRSALQPLLQLPLDGDRDLQRRLLQAEIMLQEQRAADALDALDTPPPAGAAVELQVRYHRDLAAAYRQMGNMLDAANALQAVDALQRDPLERVATQTEILRTLTVLSELVLSNLQPAPPSTSGGWMQLALLVKRHGSEPDQLDPLLAQWRMSYPQHPLLPEVLANYRTELQRRLQQVSHIAVLLPQSGTFAEVAAAIRDGILISRFQLPADRRPTLRFYDTTDPAGIWPLYTQAVTDGAELVIGPLQKEAVAQLLRAGELPIPVLALNQVEAVGVPPENLFLYALSPEDEARQAAERAWVDGRRRPVILAPQGGWGDRLAAAFEERWRGLGGSVAGIGRYDDASHDYSSTITALLHIDQSIARHRQMQGWLGRNLEFEPHRRDDADAVFMAAQPVQAQGIRPQLQFHHAADLPVYATSAAWFGTLTPDQAKDMQDIMLADIPWLLSDGSDADDDRRAIAEHLPKAESAYARLYAMGMDALRLVPHLRRLQSNRYESLDGSTGNLYMDEINRIHRQLVWVVLGEPPRILGYSPRLDLEGGAEEAAPLAPASTGAAPAP